MATFVKENTRGETLYLLRLDTPMGHKTVYLDATTRLTVAETDDTADGHTTTGPRFAYELAKASSYADYVARCATPSNLHKFSVDEYTFFTEAS